MFRMSCPTALAVALLLLAVSAIAAEPAPTVRVAVSIAPQEYFVRQIAGDLAETLVLAPAGSDPHSYEPTPRQMSALSTVKVYFAIGVPFEQAWLPRFAEIAPDMKIVDLAEAAEGPGADADRAPAVPGHSGPGHSEDLEAVRGHGHDHGEDPHIWLSPPAVRAMVPAMVEALAQADPDHAEVYRANGQAFIGQIDSLDARIGELMSGRQGCHVMIYHPAFGHFTQAYGIHQLSIETEGKEPGPRALAEIISSGKDLGIKTVFVPVQFSKRSPSVIAEALGADLQEVNPMSGDWANNLLDVAGKFSRTCASQP